MAADLINIVFFFFGLLASLNGDPNTGMRNKLSLFFAPRIRFCLVVDNGKLFLLTRVESCSNKKHLAAFFYYGQI